MVTITTSEGEIFTDPQKIKIKKNDKTEMFFKTLEEYKRKGKRREDI